LQVILFINLIIAVMTNTFETVMQFSKEEWLLQRAKFVVRTEDQINFGMLLGGVRPSDVSQSLAHQRVVIVTERADGFVEVRVPPAWMRDEQQHLKLAKDSASLRHMPAPSSYGTITPTSDVAATTGAASPTAAAAAALPQTDHSVQTFQSSDTAKDLRPGGTGTLVATFPRARRRDDVAAVLSDPEVVRVFERLLR